MFVEIGAIQPQELGELVVEQTKATLCRLFTWTDGEFWIAEKADVDREPISLKSTAPDTIMDGIARIDAWSQIEHGIGGLLAAEGDAQELASHLLQLARCPEQWEAMTRSARRRIEAHYDVRKQADALASIYRSLL